jgi:hypothetical protein
MKSLAVVLLVALCALGVAGVAAAQSGSTPSGTQAPPPAAAPPSDSTSGSGSVSTPAGDVKGRVDVDRPGDARTPAGSDRSSDGSALPRAAAGDRTTIFGLSPTAAVIIAAALLVVVILAIVAMTRSNDTYIER